MERSQGTVSVYLNNPPKEVPPGLGKAPWVMMDRFMNCSDVRDEFLKKATGKFEFFSLRCQIIRKTNPAGFLMHFSAVKKPCLVCQLVT